MILYNNMKPTEENIKKAYTEDLLGRKDDVDKFAAFLKEEYCPVSVAVDGEWGSGKTFFVKQVAYRLDEDPLDDPKKCLTVYYDAWENDNDCDPILSIVDCIARAAGAEEGSKLEALISNAYTVIKTVCENSVVQKLTKIIDGVQTRYTDAVDSYDKAVPTNVQVREKLQELYDEIIHEHGARLVIFIDELDRCRPDFAVKVLERIKHFVAIDEENRVRIVFSVNKNQLEHTIRKFYGDGFDARNYLKRFFEFVLKIPDAGILPYVTQHDVNQTFKLNTEIISATIEYFGIQIREINSFMSELISVYETAQKEGMLSLSSSAREFMQYILPIFLAAKYTSDDKYKKLVDGNGGDMIDAIWEDKLGYGHNECRTRGYLSMFPNDGSTLSDEAIIEKNKILQYLDRPFGV